MVRRGGLPTASASTEWAAYFLLGECNDSRKKPSCRTLPQVLGVMLSGSKIYRKRKLRWGV
jgi:hypothetical protein